MFDRTFALDDTGFHGDYYRRSEVRQPIFARCIVSATGPAVIRIAANDDMAVALRDFEAGELVVVSDVSVTLKDGIRRGHKFAVHTLSVDAPV